jgi:hypothetical protein
MSSSQRRLRRARARAAAVAACSTQRASDQVAAEVTAALPTGDAPRRTILKFPIGRLERMTGLSRAALRFFAELPDDGFEHAMAIGARPFLHELSAFARPAEAAE